MSYVDPSRPTGGDLYATGLLGSAIGYLVILLLFGGALAIDSNDPVAAVSLFFFGGIYMVIPAAFISALITAPLGCITAIILRDFAPPGQWHGALAGAIAVNGPLILMMGISGGTQNGSLPEPSAILFYLSIVAIGAGSGWLAQRKYLAWPETGTKAK